MKQLKYICIVLVLIISTMGCKKFLNTKPTDSLAPEQYYNNETNLISALAGVYDPIGSSNLYGLNLWGAIDGGTDDSFYDVFGATTGVNVYNFDYADGMIDGLWSDCYTGIERANQLIAYINIAAMDETKRAAILGEAKFLRGYYYFLLVQRFGDLPLRLEPTTSPIGADLAKTPTKDIYAQILKDMTDAEAALFTSTSFGYPSRISKTVAEGILARVCLNMAGKPLNDVSKYTDALAWAKKVQASGEHVLRTTYNTTLTNSAFSATLSNNAYSQIFINMCQKVYDVKESMWEAEFKGNKLDGYNELGRMGVIAGINLPATAPEGIGNCYQFFRGTGRLYKLYGNGDLRRDWALGNYTYNSIGAKVDIIASPTNIYGRNAAKWRRSFDPLTPRNTNWSPINFSILRYSDVLLMLAEAENQVNGPTAIAYDALNQVRRRAYGLPITTASAVVDAPAGMSKTDFQLFIQDERSRELCFEGLRRQDLLRWGILLPTLRGLSADPNNSSNTLLVSQNITDKHLLFPIPASELNLNKKMTQNQGW